MQRPDVRKNLRRGVYIVPTLFTMLNIFFGFRSIVNSLRAREAMTAGRPDLAVAAFEIACVSLLIAAIFDTFDGMIARQLGATSEFGKEYDSLADVVTFGTAPAVLVYAWGLHPLGKLGVGIAFLFLVSVSLRLARFNVMTGKTDYRYFVGLPSPAGALTIAALIWYAPAPVLDRRFALVILVLTACTAFAMVSPIRWRAQKGLNFRQGKSLMYIVLLAAIVAIGFAWPRQVGVVFAISYLASGPLLRLWSIAFPSRKADDVLQPAPQ
ncbi:MAG: CDP-diacylglycerol---serine O-phosphatidyltransferase [Thermoanaerobaculia bacterium]|jgi:CDP-diacylglycerol--serine O-phosphatidyltransferase|nr:CDP-diacylglycerol---serine O-phosphatidyltransferase [Thermoanaerobaculia bacterium]